MKELEIIESPEKAIALYQITPKQIAERLKQYDTLKVVAGDTKSYKQVRSTLTAIVSLRTSGDARRKKLGKNLRDGLSNINEGWKLLFAPVVPYEDRFKAELKAEDDRKEAIKAEKEKIEQGRIDGIRAKISNIQSTASNLIGFDSESLRELSEVLNEISITEDEFMEFTEEAGKVLADTSNAIQDAIIARDKFEKEEEERKAERDALNRQRLVQEAAQLKIDIENHKIQEEKRRLIQEAHDKKIREEAEADTKRKLKEKTEREERERIALEKAREAEKKRLEELSPDKEKLMKWVHSFNQTNNPYPQLKNTKAIEIYQVAFGKIEIILQRVEEQVNKL